MPSSFLDISKLSFIVADDSQFMRRLVLSALKGFGVRTVVEAATGEAAYGLVESRLYDICILDWEFPDRSGESVMRELRRPGNPLAYQTVIMMSGHSEKRRIERALRFGVDGYVVKPVAPSTLYAQIRQTILFPRRYIRTSSYLGPHHPIMMGADGRPDLAGQSALKQANENEPRHDVPVDPSASDADRFHIEDVAVLD